MRPLKFRAWDKKDELMWQPLTFSALLHGGWELETHDHSSSLPQKDYLDFAHEDTVWMQFTGLTDRNGVEVYEGDIVCVTGEFRKENCVIEWHQPKVRYDYGEEFNTLNGYVQFGRWEQVGEHPLAMHEGNFEVIGNVYEQPELLK